MSARAGSKNAALRLRLFVVGDAPNSVSALSNLRRLLAEHPGVVAELEIVDVLKQPELGLKANVLVTPTMIKLAPPGERRIIGNLKNTEALIAFLGLDGAKHD